MLRRSAALLTATYGGGSPFQRSFHGSAHIRSFLKTNRKFAIVIVLILSAVITPPDIASQVIVTIPILILYEVSIFISKVVYNRQQKELKNV